MQNKKINFLPHIYSKKPTLINNVSFTPREMDIIACLLNARGTNKTSYLLDIAPKTVRRNIENLREKLGCSSREGIIDFIEKANKQTLLRTHYSHLLIDAEFKKHLKKISKTTRSPYLCSLIFYKEPKDTSGLTIFLETLKEDLELAGIKTTIEFLETQNVIAHLRDLPENDNYSIYILQKRLRDRDENDALNMEAITVRVRQQSLLLILGGENLEEKVPESLYGIDCLDFTESKNYYLSVFELLKKLLPGMPIKDIIEEFKKRCESTEAFPESALLQESPSTEKESPFSPIEKSFLKRKEWLFLSPIIGILSVFSVWWFVLKRNEDIVPTERPGQSSSRSDLLLPKKERLLERPELIAEINDKFKEQKGIQTVVITGIGGAGKTTLARHYAHQENGALIWEINAETKEALMTSLEALAYAASKTPEEKKELRDIQEIKKPSKREGQLLLFLKNRLRTQSNWLLIYDNVEALTDIQPYFPHDPKVWGNGHVIVTTQNVNNNKNSYIENMKVINLGELSEKEKLYLFNKIINSGEDQKTCFYKDNPEKISFLKQIPSFPLDITIAAHYLKVTKAPYQEYLENLRSSDPNFSDVHESLLKESGNYLKTRYDIITLSLNHLLHANKDFGDLLLFISLLDSQNIPTALLKKIKPSTVVDNFIYHLNKYSLIIQSSKPTETLSIHRSTQALALAHLSKILNLKKDNTLLIFLTNILEEYTDELINKENLAEIKLFMNHCEKFVSHHKLLTDGERGAISAGLGAFYFYLGNYAKAKQLCEGGLSRLKTDYSNNKHRIAKASLYLGNTYRKLSDYKQAKIFLEQSLRAYKQCVPKNYAGIARALEYLGHIHKNMGSYEQAKYLTEESILTYRKHLPENQLELSRALVHLGNVYRELGDYEKAKNTLEESLLIYKKHFSENHLGIARALTYLGDVYKYLGSYEKARAMLEESSLIYKKYFSENHGGVARALENVGNIYKKLGNYEKAKSLLHESATIFKKHLPDNYVGTSRVLASLGNVYTHLGDYEKANDLLKQSLIIYKKHYDEKNIFMACALLYLGIIHREQKDFNKAKTLLEKALATYESHYGKLHAETAQVLKELSQIYFLEGNIETAEKYIHQALKILQLTKHPESYICLESLSELYLKKAAVLENQNNLEQSKDFKKQSISFLNQALEIITTHFPKDSPHSIRIRTKLKALE